MSELLKYKCINCGTGIQQLYKKYTSVLKLTSCEKCSEIADKYVEYDPVIIIIDLILLYREAYRHIIFNTSFSNHWKLAIILVLMEAYKEWVVRNRTDSKLVNLDQFHTGDLSFYSIALNIMFRTIGYILIILLFTLIYNFKTKQNKSVQQTSIEIWKCITLSSFGLFMYIPSIIWEGSINEYSDLSISLYTTLSQLLAYKVTCDCSKQWSIFVIICSYIVKTYLLSFNNYVQKIEMQCTNASCSI